VAARDDGPAQQTRRLTAELPLGFKQRLALGCAAARTARCCSSTSDRGVDPAARRDFWELIYGFRDRGMTLRHDAHMNERSTARVR